MTARKFAAAVGVNYRTVLNWLCAGRVPGAVKVTTLIGEYWDIPPAAVGMKRPKPGPKPRYHDEGAPLTGVR